MAGVAKDTLFLHGLRGTRCRWSRLGEVRIRSEHTSATAVIVRGLPGMPRRPVKTRLC